MIVSGMLHIYQIILAVIVIGNCDDNANNAELLMAVNNEFSAKLLPEVAKSNVNKSFIFSAFSILTPLAQILLASEGSSHDEVLRAIGLPDDESAKSIFTYMNEKIKTVKNVDLRMANKIYISNKFPLNDDYAALSKNVFQSDIENVDFSKSETTSKNINLWVEDQTNDRIKDLLDSSALSEYTKVLLVNVLYFKGTWKNRFDKKSTRDHNFRVSNEENITVPMMYQDGNFNYGESAELDARILEIPYEGDDSAFYVLLPNEVDGISKLKENLRDSSNLDKALTSLFNTEVEAYIPKFTIETTTLLNKILPKVGVKKVFEPSSDNLNKLLKEKEELYIDDAIQKAFIEINEEGAEAAAGNKFSVSRLAPLSSPSIEFLADHPFIFLLKIGQDILFSGAFYS